MRVFEHVGEDFRAGRRVEFDGFFGGGGGAHDVMYDVIYISSPFLCTTKSASSNDETCSFRPVLKFLNMIP